MDVEAKAYPVRGLCSRPGSARGTRGPGYGMPGGSACRLLLVATAILFSVPAAASPDIRHWTTKNGARVYFVETHELPIVDIEVVFAAGSAFDPEQLRGLAMLTGSLLDEGAGGLHADEIGYEFERVGAQFNSRTGYDASSLSLRSLSDRARLDRALANFLRVLAKPDFPDEALERQRRRFLIGIQQKRQSPAAVADEAFQAALYGDHPYAFPSEGSEESLKRIGRGEIAEFHARHYVARNAVIAIVGDLSRARARALAERISGSLPRGQASPPLPAVPPLAGAETIRIAHPSAQMHIVIGQPAMAQADPDYFPLYVGNHVLGGSGLVSRLFNVVRNERGLAYSVSSWFSPRREAGPFSAGVQTRADQAPEAARLLHDSIREFIDGGPTDEELEAAVQNLTGGFPLRLDSNQKILAYVSVIGFYGLPLDYLETFNRNIEAVTADSIRDAFRRRLDPDRLVTVMVGPVEALPEGE
jgi:zinc protease